METTYEKIVSRSGMTHMVRPVPASSSSNSAALRGGKIQTFCEFHIKPGEEGNPDGRECPNCPKAAEFWERNKR